MPHPTEHGQLFRPLDSDLSHTVRDGADGPDIPTTLKGVVAMILGGYELTQSTPITLGTEAVLRTIPQNNRH